MTMAATNKKLAALVTLLALLAGPAAGLLGSRPGCFVGWLPIVGYLVCPRTSLPPNPLLQPPSSPAPEPTGAGLSVGHYYKSSSYCPRAEELVRVAVESATNRTRGIGAGLIRLFFHDAFVRGCDASVLLNTTASGNSDTEREGPPNQNSLRGFEVIDAAKAAVEDACPGVVSCADILAFAARDASSILSGGAISFDVPAGRYDGRQSFAGETDQLPGPDSTVQQLNASFVAQGLDLADMVTLSGAHSIGRARCLFFTNHLSAMDPGYAKQLYATCNGTGSPNTRVNQDPVTPGQLDNQYYKNIDKFVLFASDAALSSSDTAGQVKDSASIPGKWEADFAAAMVKMGKIGVKTNPGFDAEIRKVCWKVNDRLGY